MTSRGVLLSAALEAGQRLGGCVDRPRRAIPQAGWRRAIPATATTRRDEPWMNQ
jgi:hypothetical protein